MKAIRSEYAVVRSIQSGRRAEAAYILRARQQLAAVAQRKAARKEKVVLWWVSAAAAVAVLNLLRVVAS